MKFKRLISLLTAAVLAGTMLFGSAAYADSTSISIDDKQKQALMEAAGEAAPKVFDESAAKIKKDEAVKIANTMLDDPDEYILTNAGLNPSYGAASANWNLSFNSKSTNTSNVNITIDADTGRITNFSIWFNQIGQKNYIATMTRPEALKTAEDFLKNRMKIDLAAYELQPQDPNQYGYKVSGIKEMVFYNFAYSRKINDIYFPNDSIYITVDGTSGIVTNYGTNFSQLDLTKLPDKSKAISPEAALEKLKNTLNMGLQYVSIYPTNPYGASAPKTVLVYAPTMSTDMIDAVSGKPIGYDGNEIVFGADPGELYSSPKQLVPAAGLPKIAEISDSDASKKAQSIKAAVEKLIGTRFDSNNAQSDMYYGAPTDGWSFNWYKNDANVNYNIGLMISKKTGLLNNISFGSYDYTKEMAIGKEKPREIKEKINWKQGKEKALAVFKEMMPEQYGLYADMNQTEPQLSDDAKKFSVNYNYTFMRVVNGFLYRDNNVNISVNRETGNIQSFYGNWADIELPKPEAIIVKQAAADKYLEGMKARLTYFQKSSYDAASGIQKFDALPMLVYNFVREGTFYGSGSYVDAVTGKLLDYSGRYIEPEAEANTPKSKDGWADRSIDLLIAQGVLKTPFPDFESAMTRGEAIKMLSLACGTMYYYDTPQPVKGSFSDVTKDSDYFYFMENAVKQGIIEKGGDLKVDEKITKAEFVKLLVKMLGFSDIAQKSEIFKLDGTNIINAGDIGSTAICSALGLLPVRTGYVYDGNASITYSEACSALYKALVYIR